MSKVKTFAKALVAHLEDELLENEVDAVVLTPRTLLSAIDSGRIKNTKTNEAGRVDRAIVVRRNSEDPGDPRAGDRRRLTFVSLFDVTILVNAGIEVQEADRDVDYYIALEIYRLTERLQDVLEKTTVSPETESYNIAIRNLADVEDPTSKFFGSIITIEASFKTV